MRAWRVAGACLVIAALPLVTASSGWAETTSGAHVPLVEEFTNTCAGGETGVIYGEMHTLITYSKTHTTMQANWQFSEGISLTGTVYQGNDVHSVVLGETKSGAFTFEIDDNYELVSQSSTSNLIVRVRVLMTFDPGTMTLVTDDRSRVDCSGSA